MGSFEIEDMIYKRKISDRTFEFAVEIVKFCNKMEDIKGISTALLSQLIRSGTSIGANLQEALSPESKKDFIHKASISTKEARETLYWLQLLKEANLVNGADIDSLIMEANEIVSILTIMVRNARRNSEI